jgi:hypothetical protein
MGSGHPESVMTRAPSVYGQCPHCQRRGVYVRQDGSIGRHRYVIERVEYECPGGAGEQDAPTGWGRRAQVTVDVVAPAEWDDRELRVRVGQILRHRLDTVHLIHVEVGP